MDKQQKKALISSIRKEITILEMDIPSFQQLAKPVAPDNAIGRLTRMEAISSKSINEATLANAIARLARLEQTLKLIDDPDFGLCIQCEEPIPYKRLLVQPDSRLCVRCAETVNG